MYFKDFDNQYFMQNFNIRVYGICIEEGKVLLIDEIYDGWKMCKFPGGGLEYGEGTVECVEREFMEEMGIKVEVGELFYLNPFFQPSATRQNEQILCVYYLIKLLESPDNVRFTEKLFDFRNTSENEQVFRWVKIADFNPNEFTFRIDKELWKEICRRFN
jgi:ADP-ribose pyrophosphatase YjhB (NUDIX family)